MKTEWRHAGLMLLAVVPTIVVKKRREIRPICRPDRRKLFLSALGRCGTSLLACVEIYRAFDLSPGARVYGHTTEAMHDIEYPPIPPPFPPRPCPKMPPDIRNRALFVSVKKFLGRHFYSTWRFIVVRVCAGAGDRGGSGGAGGLEQAGVLGDGRHGNPGSALQTGSQVPLDIVTAARTCMVYHSVSKSYDLFMVYLYTLQHSVCPPPPSD